MPINVDIIGLVSLVLAISAIVISISLGSARRDREVDKIKKAFEGYNDNCKKLLCKAEHMLNNMNAVSYSQNLRPELTVFVTRQWKFIEKTFHNRFEKHSICRLIVTDYVKDNANIFLDSGSTVDLISFELLSSNKSDITVLSMRDFISLKNSCCEIAGLF